MIMDNTITDVDLEQRHAQKARKQELQKAIHMDLLSSLRFRRKCSVYKMKNAEASFVGPAARSEATSLFLSNNYGKFR